MDAEDDESSLSSLSDDDEYMEDEEQLGCLGSLYAGKHAFQEKSLSR